MSVSLTPYLKAVSEAEDQKQEILDWIGDASDDVILNDHILVATYARRQFVLTKDGKKIWLSDEELIENRYQGKVGLLLKCGPDAFKYNGSFANITKYQEESVEEYASRCSLYTPKPGDWVLYRSSDGYEAALRRAVVKIIPSECVKMIVKDPMDWY